LKFAKWGNSIAVRIPAEVVAKLKISPNEEVQIEVTGEDSFQVRRDRSRQNAIEELRRLRIVVPDNYVFDRNEIYDR
jgi:antitoxin MazE